MVINSTYKKEKKSILLLIKSGFFKSVLWQNHYSARSGSWPFSSLGCITHTLENVIKAISLVRRLISGKLAGSHRRVPGQLRRWAGQRELWGAWLLLGGPRLPAALPWVRPREKGEESQRLASTWLSCHSFTGHHPFASGKRAVRQRCPQLTLAPMFPVVDQEHHFQDKYLFYRFLDDEHEDAPLPTEEEKKECDEELQDTLLLLSQMGPDAHMRMVLRKPWVRALSCSLGPPCARLAPARRETRLTSEVLAWLHPAPKERLQRGNAAGFASCLFLLCLSQIVPFPLLHELKL